MATLITAVVCQRLILDQLTNLVSYIDVVDGIDAQKLPVRLPQLFVGTIWQRDGVKSLRLRVTVVAPSGGIVATAEVPPLLFEPVHRRGRINCRLPVFEAAEAGLYGFEIAVRKDDGDWVAAGAVSVDVALRNELGPVEPLTPSRRRRTRSAGS